MQALFNERAHQHPAVSLTMSTAPATSFLIPSQTEIGDYRVVDHFASGGMGDVYRVVNPLLREFFAMKVLREDERGQLSDDAIARFFEEARITARLRHSNIVTIHSMGIEPLRGRLYFIMDYVGVSPKRRDEILHNSAWFSRDTTEEGLPNSRIPLTLEDVFKANGPIQENILRILAADIARALHAAHTFGDGIVHCDLKPANILLRNDGHAVVTDFGIARVRDYNRSETVSASSILGTPDYMAPEQRRPDAELTPATDIYAYGVMLCKLLTGAFPVGVWTRPSAIGLNPVWDTIIEKCIERTPAHRWTSMVEILRLLHAMPTEAKRLRRRQSVRKVVFYILGGVALLILSLAFLCFLKFAHTDASSDGWFIPQPDPEHFLNEDVVSGRLAPDEGLCGVLTYAEAAPANLPKPPRTYPYITTLALPASTRSLPPDFITFFPRLEAIACHTDNPTFFVKDGILYRYDTPHQPFMVPPRLYGEVTLPDTVTTFQKPDTWHRATTTPETLTSLDTGAYGQPLIIRAPRPITWK